MTRTRYIPHYSLFVATFIGLYFGSTTPILAADEDAVTPEQRAVILKTFRDEVTPFLKNYCMECHGDKNSKKGDLSFNGVFGRPGAGEFRRQWQATMVNVKDHSMPPEDEETTAS